MKLLTDGSEKDQLLGFCLSFVARHVQNWPPEEEVLAEEFINWFRSKLFLDRNAMKELCRLRGVNLSFAALPQEIKGFNCSFHNKREIVIAEKQIVGFGDLHTLFHEFREMLEHSFVQLGYPTIGPEMFLEGQAEDFAVTCRMAAFHREAPSFISMVANIEKKWARYLAFGFLGVFVVAYLVSCAFLPQMEESFSETLRQRYIRT